MAKDDHEFLKRMCDDEIFGVKQRCQKRFGKVGLAAKIFAIGTVASAAAIVFSAAPLIAACSAVACLAATFTTIQYGNKVIELDADCSTILSGRDTRRPDCIRKPAGSAPSAGLAFSSTQTPAVAALPAAAPQTVPSL